MSTRRNFMQQAGLIAAGLMIRPAGIFSMGHTKAVKKIGIQLYTLRDQLAKDVKGTIRKVAQTGYDHVETFYGYEGPGQDTRFWGLTLKELKALLKDNDLPTHSGHYQLNDFLTRGNGNDTALKTQIAIAAELGQQHLVVPVPPVTLLDKLSVDDFKFMAAQLNKAGELCRKSGLKAGYHNHFWEFRHHPGVKETGYEILLKETEASLVNFELDLFWAIKSGIDPVALFREHPGRFAMWHVKDIDKAHAEKITGPAYDTKPSEELLANIKFAEVGTGTVNFNEIFAAAGTAGLQYAFVEQDQITIDPFVSIRESYSYVKQHLLK